MRRVGMWEPRKLPSKARYQRLLESKLDGLEAGGGWDSSASSGRAYGNRCLPVHTRPASPVQTAAVHGVQVGSLPCLLSAHCHHLAPRTCPGYPRLWREWPTLRSSPHPYGWPYFSYPHPYYGPPGLGTYASYQPTNNHNPIIPPDMQLPFRLHPERPRLTAPCPPQPAAPGQSSQGGWSAVGSAAVPSHVQLQANTWRTWRRSVTGNWEVQLDKEL